MNNTKSGNTFQGIYCDNSSPDITNNTITSNGSYGIYCSDSSSPDITNTIIWGNTTPQINVVSGSPTVSYSCVQDGYGSGTNIIDSDPQFTDADNGDYSLRGNSPCVNAGKPDTSGLNLPLTDLAGNARIYNDERIDIGAYEYLPNVWDGSENANWANADNWSKEIVPDIAENVFIPNAGNSPEISANAECQDITIENAGNLIISTGCSLSISGDFVLEDGGAFTNNGKMIFIGNDCHLSDYRAVQSTLGDIQVGQ